MTLSLSSQGQVKTKVDSAMIWYVQVHDAAQGLQEIVTSQQQEIKNLIFENKSHERRIDLLDSAAVSYETELEGCYALNEASERETEKAYELGDARVKKVKKQRNIVFLIALALLGGFIIK